MRRGYPGVCGGILGGKEATLRGEEGISGVNTPLEESEGNVSG